MFFNVMECERYTLPLLKFINILREIDFPGYDNFDNMNRAYSDFIKKVEVSIDKITPFKKICIKSRTSEWFDLEILNRIKSRDKLFKKFKKTKSYNDHENYKKARNNIERIIKNKKKVFYRTQINRKYKGNNIKI